MAVNRSKAREPRFWARWKAAGAVSVYCRLLFLCGTKVGEREALLHRKKSLEITGRLDEGEIEEFLIFNFIRGPATVEEQVRRYYLLVKNGNVSDAKILNDTIAQLLVQPRTMENVREICFALYRHVHYVLIRFDGRSYVVRSGQFGLFDSLV